MSEEFVRKFPVRSTILIMPQNLEALLNSFVPMYSCTHVPRPNASGRFELNKGFEDFVPMYSRTQTKCIRYIFSNIGFENFVPMYPVRNTILIMPQNLEAL